MVGYKEIKPIKIAILSCNHGHAKGYYSLQDDPLFELVGVSVAVGYYNRVELERLRVPIYQSDEELYAAHPDLEAVIIGSDNKSHIKQVREAVRRKLHIFSMKVPTFDMDEYREMIRMTEEAGVVFEIELEMRLHSTVLRMKELLQQGAVGKPLAFNIINYSHNPVWWRPWQCDPELSYGKAVPLRPNDYRYRGGGLADHPHIFDLMRYLTDSSYKTVYAQVSPNIRKTAVVTEDMVRVIGKMQNGITFSLDPSYANDEHKVPVQIDWEKYPRCVEVYMSVAGTDGVIISDLYGKTSFSQRGKDGEYMYDDLENPGIRNRIIHKFYQSVRYGKTPDINLRNHLETIQVMNAAYDSISTGKIIDMDTYYK